MSPTIVLDGGAPLLAVGSPGGSTIITTVAAILLNRIDRGMTLPAAVTAPRATQRNTSAVVAEARYLRQYGAELEALGHELVGTGELGAATGLEFLKDGRLLAAAERRRRGGGDAGVVQPSG